MIFYIKKGKNSKEDNLLTRIKHLKKGEILYRQNDTDSDMYILNKGRCGVYIDDEFLTEISEPGAIIGESSALMNKARSATITALEDSEFTVIPAEYIDNIIQANPEIGINLIKAIAQRLHYTGKLAANLQKQVIQLKNEIALLKGEKGDKEQYKLIELFYKAGIITENQLNEVLKIQKDLKARKVEKSVGQILMEKGYATMAQIMQMVRLQYELKNEEKLISNIIQQSMDQ
ncbi:MAG: Crp/Fnr family transcriptional regulator [bacterium]|nr:Crp/Fnr family transcriptional regulator [bacterium]